MNPRILFDVARGFLATVILVGFSLGAAFAQDAPPTVRVACVKAAPGQGMALGNFMRNEALAVHKARLGVGNLTHVEIWQAVIPAGRRAECDYVVANSFDGFPEPTLPLEEAVKKANIGMTADEFRELRGKVSYLADTSMWTGVAGVGEIKAGNYVRFNYMNVHDMDTWIDLEKNTWKGIMEARVAEGKLQAWRCGRLVLPDGTDRPFNAGTLDVFADWNAIGQPQEMERMLQKAHPGRNWQDISARGQTARDIVKAYLWVVVASESASKH